MENSSSPNFHDFSENCVVPRATGVSVRSVARRWTRPVLSALFLAALFPLSAHASGSAAGTDNWANVTSNLANMQSECGNLTLLSSTPGVNTLIAGIAQQGLWASADGGASWQRLGTGQGSA